MSRSQGRNGRAVALAPPGAHIDLHLRDGAVRQYSIGDYFFTFLGFIGLAVPNFMLALIIMYFGLRWFGVSVGGLFSADQQLLQQHAHG